MLTQQNRDELESRGVTVIKDVLSSQDCDRHVASYRRWLGSFPLSQWPQSRNSLIQRYKTGHLTPSWEVRLAAKPVFSQLWNTDCLLSSMDAVAIGRPPEESMEAFWSAEDNWLHVDQTVERQGLHAYQGAVYLQHSDHDDWTFECIPGSHRHFDSFAEHLGREEQLTSMKIGRTKLRGERDVRWFEEKGCTRQRVPCPKGGMILWDSRTVHANARPMKGRDHPQRWRYVVFVCMTPAAWASPQDLAIKAQAYEKMQLTTHWPSQGVRTFSEKVAPNSARDPNPRMQLPAVARTDDAKRLVGVLPYRLDCGQESFTPVWKEGLQKTSQMAKQKVKK